MAPIFVASVSIRAFKSFGAETVKFGVSASQGLLGIVGPNGAGKSNVLDAICWAAGCLPSLLRVKTLRELVCQGLAPELCCVELELSHAKGQTVHTLRTSLTPDCAREYRIDGKFKTGQQVTAFLHSQGLYLDSQISVIRQAQVTKVADNSSPDSVAQVIADSSGLSWWMQEAARANDELGSTRKALVDIQSSIRVLKQAMHQDEQDQLQIAKAEQLDGQIEAAAEQLAARLRRQVQVLGSVMEEQGAQRDRVAEELRCLVQEQERLEAEVKARQAAAAERQQQQRGGSSAKARQGLAQLARQLATQEAHVQALTRQLATSQELEAEAAQLLERRHGLQAKLQDLEEQREKLLQLQEAMEDVQAGLGAGALQQLEGQAQEACSHALHLRQLLEAEQQACARAEQEQGQAEGRLKACQSSSARAEERWRVARAQVDHLTGGMEGDPGTSSSPVGSTDAAGSNLTATAVQKLLEEAEQQLSRISMRKQVLERFLPQVSSQAAQQDVSSGASRGGPANISQLHQCFSFKDAQPPGTTARGVQPSPAADKFIKALATVAGGNLHVYVCNNRAEAACIMENPRAVQQRIGGSSGKLRLWPLDSITAPETSAQQQAAVQALGSGRAWLPLALLQPCLPAYAACLRRAFGGMLIVSDEAAASQVSVKHRLACVTLDGLVSRPGTVSGGWSGRGLSPNESLLQNKLEGERAAAQEATLVERVHRLKELQRLLQVAEDAAAALRVRQDEEQVTAVDLQTAVDAVKRLGASVERLRAECECAEEEAERCEEALAAALQQQAALRDGQRGAGMLQKELDDAAVKLLELRQRRDQATAELEQVEDRLEEVTAWLGSQGSQGAAGADQEGCGQDGHCRQSRSATKAMDLQEAEKKLKDLAEQLAGQRTAEEQQQRDLQEAEKHLQQLCKQLKQAKEAQRKQSAEESALAKSLASLKATQDKATSALTQLLDSMSGAASEMELMEGDAAAGLRDGGEARAEVLALGVKEGAAQLERLKAERSKVKIRVVPLAEQLLRQERVETLHRLQEQYSSLEAAVKSLDQGIGEARKQVLEANEAVFLAVNRAFQRLCSMMLPSMTLALSKTQQCSSKGLVVQFTGKAAGTGSNGSHGQGGAADAVSGSLEQLSGGQRTLVSLALLLAAAASGNHSSTLLLDEVDAALDEHNQKTMTKLLRDLAQRSQVQLICVSHHEVVHRACDALVHLSRGAGGSTVASTPGQQESLKAVAQAANTAATGVGKGPPKKPKAEGRKRVRH